MDARGGKVALAGWTERSEVDAAEAVAELGGRGVGRFLFTPIEVDGTMEGPGPGGARRGSPRRPTAEILYSGGVGDLGRPAALAAAAPANVDGVIVGRALYEGRFTVAEAKAAARRSGAA